MAGEGFFMAMNHALVNFFIDPSRISGILEEFFWACSSVVRTLRS